MLVPQFRESLKVAHTPTVQQHVSTSEQFNLAPQSEIDKAYIRHLAPTSLDNDRVRPCHPPSMEASLDSIRFDPSS